MKLVKKIFSGVFALTACGALFFSCSNAAGDSNALTSTTTQPAQTGGTGATGAAEIKYNKIWEGNQKIDWGDNGVTMDHALFSEDFDSLRITYNASAGAIKLSVCDPWTDIALTAASISDGTVANDGAFNLPTGDNQTVTVKLSAANVSGIKGQGVDGAWGGLKIYGADTVTLKKVESFKAAAASTTTTTTTTTTTQTTQTGAEQTQTPAGGSEQTQTAATVQYTSVFEGSKTINWGEDKANNIPDKALTLDHALFTADFNALRITYNASAGAIKLAVCDPWTVITLTDASISSGSVASDGTFNLPTGDAQTVTVKLSDADVAAIKGQGVDGAWGGLKIFGADTITLTKVESFKDAAATTTQQPQTTNGGEQTQTQTPTYTDVWSGEQTIDWGATGQLKIDHALFNADFNALRITYNASAGAIKLVASDPWTNITLTGASISSGSIAEDGAFNLPTGDNQTVTIKLSAEDVAKIKGQNTDGAWGGLTIQGAATITITKVESFKQ